MTWRPMLPASSKNHSHTVVVPSCSFQLLPSLIKTPVSRDPSSWLFCEKTYELRSVVEIFYMLHSMLLQLYNPNIFASVREISPVRAWSEANSAALRCSNALVPCPLTKTSQTKWKNIKTMDWLSHEVFLWPLMLVIESIKYKWI